jgi:hypothetical protein
MGGKMPRVEELGSEEIYGYMWEIVGDLPDGVELFVKLERRIDEAEVEKYGDGAKAFAEELAALIGELNDKKVNDTEFVI